MTCAQLSQAACSPAAEASPAELPPLPPADTLCQVPSNLILMKVGAPLWLSIIIVSWGVTATAFAGLNGTTSFYVLRLLLGCTEAGTFPGVGHLEVLPGACCVLRLSPG